MSFLTSGREAGAAVDLEARTAYQVKTGASFERVGKIKGKTW